MNNYEVKENELLFAKVREGAIIPTKEAENAGYDIYACFDEDFMIIPAHETVMIPTGIASAFNKKFYAQLEERGSTGSKGIKRSAGVIDSGYRGEWFVALTNTNNDDMIISKISKEEFIQKYCVVEDCCVFGKDVYYKLDEGRSVYITIDNEDCVIFYPYEKAIAQAIMHEVPEVVVGEIDLEDLQAIPSQRGTGKLGSSNK